MWVVQCAHAQDTDAEARSRLLLGCYRNLSCTLVSILAMDTTRSVDFVSLCLVLDCAVFPFKSEIINCVSLLNIYFYKTRVYEFSLQLYLEYKSKNFNKV